MTRALLLLSTEAKSLSMLSLGLLHALDRQGVRVAYFKPIARAKNAHRGSGTCSADRSCALVARHQADVPSVEPLPRDRAEDLCTTERESELEAWLLERYEELSGRADTIIIEGVLDDDATLAHELNQTIAGCLAPSIAVLQNVGELPDEDVLEALELFCKPYRAAGLDILGVFLNCVPEERLRAPGSRLGPFQLLGCFPFVEALTEPRVVDLMRHLDASVIAGEGGLGRRVRRSQIAAMTVANALAVVEDHSLLITGGDRDDIVLAAAAWGIAADRGPLSGLVLSGGLRPSPDTLRLIEAVDTETLPVLSVPFDTYETAARVRSYRSCLEVDDTDKAQLAMRVIAEGLAREVLLEALAAEPEQRLSPAAFRFRIAREAIAADRCIVLPEGDEPRTLAAAGYVLEHRLARLILLGDVEKIRAAAQKAGAEIAGAELIDPARSELRQRFAEEYTALRAHKGMTLPHALDLMLDTVYFGTMMVHNDLADGLVSGAVHTTAHTIRPAFEIIKTSPGYSVVSSVFFMCLRDRVLVYGDCAVNPDPSAEQLAEIAIQSARTARAFGVEPKVAMLSYSTGTSGSGREVEKVRKATARARALDPTLVIDGPLQYDAAAVVDVAAQKAPDSPVAGHATVLIFPDLNAGNTTYKAVQRSADAIAVGPVLQGLKKPVNDLSRGSLVEDIIYTIAITALQARQIAEAATEAR